MKNFLRNVAELDSMVKFVIVGITAVIAVIAYALYAAYGTNPIIAIACGVGVVVYTLGAFTACDNLKRH